MIGALRAARQPADVSLRGPCPTRRSLTAVIPGAWNGCRRSLMHKTKLQSLGAVGVLAALAMPPLFPQATPPCAPPAVTPRADVEVATTTPVARASDSPLDEYQALLNQAEENLRQWPGYAAVFV